jgi:hypothetical protein
MLLLLAAWAMEPGHLETASHENCAEVTCSWFEWPRTAAQQAIMITDIPLLKGRSRQTHTDAQTGEGYRVGTDAACANGDHRATSTTVLLSSRLLGCFLVSWGIRDTPACSSDHLHRAGWL